jgi:mitochondrial import inner membrane translocase subunit TIM17
MRSPILGGNFGVWGLLFSVFDCSFAYVRGVEDPWNAIMSGGATGGLLAARAGPRAIGRNALVGAVLLALIEGIGIAINKAVMKTQMDAMSGGKQDTLDPPIPPGFGTRILDPSKSIQSSAAGFQLQ